MGTGTKEISCHGKNIHPPKQGRHTCLSSTLCSSLRPGQGLNSASSGTEDSFLLVHVRSVSVNVAAFFILRAVLVSIHWRPMLYRSTSAGRARALWIEMHRPFQLLLAAIKPMIKSPRFASLKNNREHPQYFSTDVVKFCSLLSKLSLKWPQYELWPRMAVNRNGQTTVKARNAPSRPSRFSILSS